ncbi:class I SAM-dependent methyltransferase [Nocardia sp. NPDC127526]|uniref:class I SAM-dependent methyltransferase n=1 Tax=Nocardia sp. NPDC127526 TaxID=3345393 RepID=UPI00362BC2F3
MPRGGPDATWLDRLLQTDRPEYTDRADVPDSVKQKVIAALGYLGNRFGTHEANAQLIASMVDAIAEPRILELGAGHGQLSQRLLDVHPGALVTITDVDPALVANIAAGPLGAHPRATVRIMDATAIDAAENSFDLVLFAAGFHHLPPAPAAKAIAEGTRVGARFVVIDGIRPSARELLVRSATLPPIVAAVMASSLRIPWAAIPPTVHDCFITCLRNYSRSAFEALAAAADPVIDVEFPVTDRVENDDKPVIFARP